MDRNAFDGLALLHDLVPFLPVDRLHAILNEVPLPDEAYGVVLFADISGFTTLAETLSRELGPERGAEELNTQVNYTFAGLIDAVDRYHGSVLRFSGDALMAWFTGPDCVWHAVIAAQAMRAVMQAVAPVLPWLQLKIGVGCGPAKRFSPGDPALGVFDMLTGPAITQMSRAEQLAQPGQIIISPDIGPEIGGLFKVEPVSADGYLLVKPTIFVPDLNLPSRWKSIRWMDHIDRAWDLVAQCRPYLPAPIYERLQGGRGGYMTDLRMVTPLFIRFSGIDYAQPDAAQRLDEMVRVAQMRINEFGGHLNEVGVDDKGSILVALFGAPVALENPAQRATHAALALQDRLPYVETLHFGLTVGRLFTGTVGSPMRRAYAVIGDEVNLAARLMGLAGPGEIFANYAAYEMADDFAWETLSPIRVKGKVAPVRVYRLLGMAEITRPIWPAGRFVARTRELAALNWALSTGKDKQGRTLLMIGEPGLGKSHLLGKFEAMLKERGITGLVGVGRSIERQMPYRAWRDVFSQYFELSKHSTPEDQRQQIEARLSHIAPELIAQAPLLNDVMPVEFPENRFTESLEPAERHSALVNLLIALLRAWLEEDALAITLDDAQWLDMLSWDLAYKVAQNIADRPLTLLVSMRPIKSDVPLPYRLLTNLPNTRQLILQPLDAENAHQLIAEQLQVGEVPESVVQIVMQKTGGNPFFIKEISSVLQEHGITSIVGDRVVLKGDPVDLKLPDTVQGIVRSRIDRLTPDQQILLKVAAVIGPQFSYHILRAIQPLRLSEEDLQANLAALDSMDLHLEERRGDESVYAFQYAITREVAYNALSFSQRRQLHRAVAQWYEQEYRDNLAPYYTLLTHHWRAAENREKERHYSYLAGVRAAAQYANNDAISYLVRTLELTPSGDTQSLYDILTRLEDLYHLNANRDGQYSVLSTISTLADEQDNDNWRARVGTQWARLYESMSQYESCIKSAEEGFEAAHRMGNREIMGLSDVYRGLGLMHLGRYEQAQEVLGEVHAPDNDGIEAWRLDVLGATLARLGDYDEALRAYQQAQQKGNAAGDRAAVGQTLNNMGDAYMALGDFERASEYYWRALTIRRAIGDRQGEAQTLSSLGELSLAIGDHEEGLNYLEQTREVFQTIDDPAGEATALHNIGLLHSEQQDYHTAHSRLDQALALRLQIGDLRGASSVLLDLALSETELGDLSSAGLHLTQADNLSRQVDLTTRRALDFRRHALLGLVALRQGHKERAFSHIETTRKLAGTHDLDEIPSLIKICIIGHEIMMANDCPVQARQFLEKAYAQLTARANRITDPEKRARYLLTIPSHRDLIVLYEQQKQP